MAHIKALSVEYKVLRTANAYDWIIATADSKPNNAICVIIKIANKDVCRKGPVFSNWVNNKCPCVRKNPKLGFTSEWLIVANVCSTLSVPYIRNYAFARIQSLNSQVGYSYTKCEH